MRTVNTTLTILAAALVLPAAGFAAGKAKGRITPAQAETAAVKKIAGKALSAKYEFEDGRWQYAVLVQKGKELFEVEVDSKTAKIYDTEKTTMADEKAEAAADAKVAAMHGDKGEKATTKVKDEDAPAAPK